MLFVLSTYGRTEAHFKQGASMSKKNYLLVVLFVLSNTVLAESTCSIKLKNAASYQFAQENGVLVQSVVVKKFNFSEFPNESTERSSGLISSTIVVADKNKEISYEVNAKKIAENNCLVTDVFHE